MIHIIYTENFRNKTIDIRIYELNPEINILKFFKHKLKKYIVYMIHIIYTENYRNKNIHIRIFI